MDQPPEDLDPHQQGALAAQDDFSSESSDSGYGDETALSTASLQSSVFDYEEEHGRSYHAFRRGKYVMPNDEREQERMDMHYHSLRLALNNRHWIAPIEEPKNVLDVGTGTGIWAMDVADDNPSTQITGIDLSPIQPTAVPPNLQFLIMDADEPWDGGVDAADEPATARARVTAAASVGTTARRWDLAVHAPRIPPTMSIRDVTSRNDRPTRLRSSC